jgi:hypothetical protein
MVGLALVLRDIVQRRLGPWPASARSRSARDLGLSRPVRHRRRLGRRLPALRAGGFRGLYAAAAPALRHGRRRLERGRPRRRQHRLPAWLAFGSLDFLAGQIIGKAWMVLLALPLMHLLRRRDERLGLMPA